MRSMHAILGFQADVKAEAIDRGHLRPLCLNASKPFGEQNERIFVIGIHVLDVVALMFDRLGQKPGPVKALFSTCRNWPNWRRRATVGWTPIYNLKNRQGHL